VQVHDAHALDLTPPVPPLNHTNLDFCIRHIAGGQADSHGAEGSMFGQR
jgi:hypothetical protein